MCCDVNVGIVLVILLTIKDLIGLSFNKQTKIMQYHRMLKLQISKYGDASPAFSTSINPHQHLTYQPSTGLPHKIKSALAYCRLVHP